MTKRVHPLGVSGTRSPHVNPAADAYDFDTDADEGEEKNEAADKSKKKNDIRRMDTKARHRQVAVGISSERNDKRKKSKAFRRLVQSYPPHQSSSMRVATMRDTDDATKKMVVDVKSCIFRIRNCSDASMFFALLGLALEITARELEHKYVASYLAGGEWETVVTTIRWLVSISTVFLMLAIYLYYHYSFQFLKLNRVYLNNTGWNQHWIWACIIEMLVCAIHTPPYMNYMLDISLDDISTPWEGPVYVTNPLGLLMFFRLYILIRFTKNRYYSGGVRILGMWFNFNLSDAFAIRHLLYQHPLVTLLPVLMCLQASAGYIMFVSERAVPGRVFHYSTALYLVNITMLGVGYGDFYPWTATGRTVSITVALSAQVFSAVLVASVAQTLTLFPYEMRMVEFLGDTEIQTSLKMASARLIARVWRERMAKKKNLATVRKTVRGYRALQSMYDFHVLSQMAKNSEKRFASVQLFRTMLERVNDTLESSFKVMMLMDPSFNPETNKVPVLSEEKLSTIVKNVDKKARAIEREILVGEQEQEQLQKKIDRETKEAKAAIAKKDAIKNMETMKYKFARSVSVTSAFARSVSHPNLMSSCATAKAEVKVYKPAPLYSGGTLWTRMKKRASVLEADPKLFATVQHLMTRVKELEKAAADRKLSSRGRGESVVSVPQVGSVQSLVPVPELGSVPE